MKGNYSLMVGVAAIGLASCMLVPTDDGHVVSASAPLSFVGYVLNPGVLVQVQARNTSTGVMEDVGAPVLSETTELKLSDGKLYPWSTSIVLGPQHWTVGPPFPRFAEVGAQMITSNGSRWSVMTVESNWVDCFSRNPNIADFNKNCGSDRSPIARIQAPE